eukprot:GHVU01059261.1.p1 GENE.GHVU01059261.1~~GHVU01059261.1.p1  ORF type:complete len:156 (+),score=1.75 GHVU01059261.1:1036-1503(+)
MWTTIEGGRFGPHSSSTSYSVEPSFLLSSSLVLLRHLKSATGAFNDKTNVRFLVTVLSDAILTCSPRHLMDVVCAYGCPHHSYSYYNFKCVFYKALNDFYDGNVYLDSPTPWMGSIEATSNLTAMRNAVNPSGGSLKVNIRDNFTVTYNEAVAGE